LKMITLFTEFPGFGTDYSVSIKLADFIAVFSDSMFFTECLKSSDSTLVVENGGFVISSIFQSFDEQRADSINIYLEAPP